MYAAPTRAECTRQRAWEGFVAFHDFPEEHWSICAASNPIGRIYTGLRLRTTPPPSAYVRVGASSTWSSRPSAALASNGGPSNGLNQLLVLIAGERFVKRQAAAASEHGGRRRVAHSTDVPGRIFTTLDKAHGLLVS